MLCKQCNTQELSKRQTKFCSCSCAALYNNPLRAKNKIILCETCNNETRNPRFCSNKCKGVFLRYNKPKNCQICDSIITNKWTDRKYCDDCKTKYNSNYVDWSKVTIQDLKNKLKTYQYHARIRDLARREYVRSNKNRFCKNCPYRNTFQVCHIKPISSFSTDTTIDIVNQIDNLVALCPNCHWDLDHGFLLIK